MKPVRAPSHQALMRPYFKNKPFKEKIKRGVERLKVITQIIELREKLGLTQAELARRMNVSQPFIARIESDESANLSLETLIKIVKALNAEIDICIYPRRKAA